MDINKYLQTLELDRLDQLQAIMVSPNYDHSEANSLQSHYNIPVEDIDQEEFQYMEDPKLFVLRYYEEEELFYLRLTTNTYKTKYV